MSKVISPRKAKGAVPKLPSNSWIQTHTGLKFDYVRDYWEHDDICITDIAVTISRAPRYCGHTLLLSCVAQHCVHVSEYIAMCRGSIRDQFVGLLHDATEAYLTDMPSPAKALMPEYVKLERSIWVRISHKYLGEVIDPLPPIVKQADQALLVAEAWDSFEYPPLENWTDKYCDRANFDIVPWPELYAKKCFLEKFDVLSELYDKEVKDGKKENAVH
jgi:5'-deoxynucleotidase YfbR-like HD superfamily hydrolase